MALSLLVYSDEDQAALSETERVIFSSKLAEW